MEKKEKTEKKGFWASLFSSKPGKCSCGNAYVIPAEDKGKESDEANNACGIGIKEIKVLGPGCAKCKSAYAVMEKVVKESGIDVELTKVDDIEEIMRYNIMSTPAVVIDGKVVLKGKVPSEPEARELLGLS